MSIVSKMLGCFSRKPPRSEAEIAEEFNRLVGNRISADNLAWARDGCAEEKFNQSTTNARMLADIRSLSPMQSTRLALTGVPPSELSSIVAGAIYDFAGFLSTREVQLRCSAHDDSAPVAKAVVEWAKLRGLNLDAPAIHGWSLIVCSKYTSHKVDVS